MAKLYNAKRCRASRVHVESKLLLTLWALATQESFHKLATDLGLTVALHIPTMLRLL